MDQVQFYDWGYAPKKNINKWLLICNNCNLEEHFKDYHILRSNTVHMFAKFRSNTDYTNSHREFFIEDPIIYKGNTMDITVLRRAIIDKPGVFANRRTDPVFYFEFLNSIYGLAAGGNRIDGKATKIILNGQVLPNPEKLENFVVNTLGIGWFWNHHFPQIYIDNLVGSEMIIYFDKI